MGSQATQAEAECEPAHETLRQLRLGPLDVLVVQDLKPGVDAANVACVDAAVAGWSHNIPSIGDFMNRLCAAHFATVPEFAEFMLQQSPRSGWVLA
jgi:phosphoglycolate phosphatase/pyrophosphatase PpaX